MVVGFYFPGPGNRAAGLGATSLATAGIFLLSGLSLKKEEALGALRSWREVLFGLVSILAITPALAAPLAAALPLEPAALSAGLAVFFCMPTTLSSGVALTSAAGGDAALALLLTVSSNLRGVITAPSAVATLLGSSNFIGSISGGANGAARATAASALAIDPVPLLRALAVSVAAPLVLGAVLRSLSFGKKKQRWFARVADTNKRKLAYLSAALLAVVPWTQVSRAVASEAAAAAAAGARASSSPLSALPPAGPLAVAAAAGLAIHSLLLLFNYLAVVKVLKLGGGASGKRAQQAALVLCASQKTLTVAVPALAALCASTKNGAAFAATAMMPVVLVHMLQTVRVLVFFFFIYFLSTFFSFYRLFFFLSTSFHSHFLFSLSLETNKHDRPSTASSSRVLRLRAEVEEARTTT
jgi:solute carrier family 10 (sodium/bile acid cotransporter), member 7